jgi:hypothetical protein
MDDKEVRRSGLSKSFGQTAGWLTARLATFALGCAMLSAPLATHAHHSFAATYFTDRTITLKGQVVQFMFRNPHTLLQITVPGEKGSEPVRWAIEWAATLALTQSGVTKNAIKAGDEVVVTGYPPRNPIDHRLRLKTIERPKDGWKWGGDFS